MAVRRAVQRAAAGGGLGHQTLAPTAHDLSASIAAAVHFARSELQGNDASHDFWCARCALSPLCIQECSPPSPLLPSSILPRSGVTYNLTLTAAFFAGVRPL